MGATKKAKITFTCSHELKEFLETWAESESRTLSNLVEKIVEEAASDKHLPPPAKKINKWKKADD
jgi:hypothetical protein